MCGAGATSSRRVSAPRTSTTGGRNGRPADVRVGSLWAAPSTGIPTGLSSTHMAGTGTWTGMVGCPSRCWMGTKYLPCWRPSCGRNFLRSPPLRAARCPWQWYRQPTPTTHPPPTCDRWTSPPNAPPRESCTSTTPHPSTTWEYISRATDTGRCYFPKWRVRGRAALAYHQGASCGLRSCPPRWPDRDVRHRRECALRDATESGAAVLRGGAGSATPAVF
mmetsp:Transcript_44592/g.87437  ORF Transcript_44592/g.87437 Transcript_44592/m.87437 type:complete len:220 (-) Transcript_44592:104-763(-)